jgi:hypothetical protein
MVMTDIIMVFEALPGAQSCPLRHRHHVVVVKTCHLGIKYAVPRYPGLPPMMLQHLKNHGYNISHEFCICSMHYSSPL